MKFGRKQLQGPPAIGILISILVGAAFLVMRANGYLESLELKAYDVFVDRQPREMHASSSIVIVGVNDQDIQELGHYPVSDAELAQVLTNLEEYEPRVIGIDIYRDIEVPPGRDALDSVLTGYGNIVAIWKYGAGNEIRPPPVLEGTEQLGFNNQVTDGDEVIRRALVAVDDGDNFFWSFSLLLSLYYLYSEEITIDWLSDGFRLGKATFPVLDSNDGGYVQEDTSGYQFLLDFRGPRSFETLSFTEALSGRMRKEQVQGKIVLIGVTSESVKDYFNTPTGTNTFGTVVHAHAVDQLVRGALYGSEPMAVWAGWQEGIWILFWSLLGGALGLSVRSPLKFSVLVVMGLLVLTAVGFWAFWWRLWVPVVPPSMVWFGSAAIVTSYVSYLEKQDRTVLMSLFSRYISQDVAETIWNSRDELLEGGRVRPMMVTATVLFTDLKGFTSVSEGMDPRALMDWLNEYMESMSSVVMNHGGVINKYIGDSIMAVFGVPVHRTTEEGYQQDARNAVRCALAMRQELGPLNALWQTQQLPSVGMRIGVHTGPLVAGSLGSADRLEYTVIGDTVNITSRLESFDKNLMDEDISGNDCRILISADTFKLLGGEFRSRLVGSMNLKGKQEKVTIYGVIGSQEGIDEGA